ncbi:MAG: hypothetical protein CH6_0113 [Candidatus Kapaibacterium sp.]|nr:MAG: hypothetical protein CH6_0113 [Candidatus Kapabacteria bacterium]
MENELKVEDLIERLKEYFNAKTLADLSKHLGIKEVTLAGWKYRNSFDLVRMFPRLKGIDWHWLITGQGEMTYDSRKQKELVAQVEYLLRQIKRLEEENDLLKAMIKNLLAGKEEGKEPENIEETVKVPMINLPDETEIYKREMEKGGGIYAREGKRKEKKQ